MWVAVGIVSMQVAAACSCAPPPPLPPGMQPGPRIPILGKDKAVFVGRVDEIYPWTLSDYEAMWRRMYGEELWENEKPPSVQKMREFVLQIWPKLFSPEERKRINEAKTRRDLHVSPFRLTPRRVRLSVMESFAGPRGRNFELYTGLGGGDCGVDFEVGEEWLVDAGLDGAGRWIARHCTATSRLSHAREALHELRSMQTKR
jgi:hypothetical protein